MSRLAPLALSLFLFVACTAPGDAPQETDAPPEMGATQGTSDWASRIQAVNQALLNEGDLDRIPEFFSESYVAHGPDGGATGHDAIRGFVSALREAFPDLEVETQVLATDGDRVAWIRTHTGTHEGAFMGVEPTGEVVTWQAVIVTRYEDGLIAEEWGASGLGNRLLTQ